MPKFAWAMGLNGPEPQVLHDDSVFGVTGDKKDGFLAIHPITVTEANLPLSELAIAYPYEVKDATD